MSKDNQFPKMLYRSNQIEGTTEVFGKRSVFYAIAADASEMAAMLENGFRKSVYPDEAAPAEQPQASPTKAAGRKRSK